MGKNAPVSDERRIRAGTCRGTVTSVTVADDALLGLLGLPLVADADEPGVATDRLTRWLGPLVDPDAVAEAHRTAAVVAPYRRDLHLPDDSVADVLVTVAPGAPPDGWSASVVVIGAGAVGLEFTSLYRSFGADVTVIEALPRVAPLEDEQISKEVARAFRKRGITTVAGASVQRVSDTGDTVTVTYDAGKGEVEVVADVCLVAIGRRPVTEGLGLAEAGVALHDKDTIIVDEQLRTNVDHVWAIGDVAATPLQLAHAAFTEGYAVAERIAGLDVPVIDYLNIPKVTYCTPEIASVGLTEEQAREAGLDVVVDTVDFRAIGKANMLGEGGIIKLVAEADGPVRGVHMVGPHVTDLIAEGMLTQRRRSRGA